MDVDVIYNANCIAGLKTLPDGCIHTCVTSPPYWGLRDYNVSGQIGLEPTPDDYVERLIHVFREVRRVLRPDGTLWLNLGDSYASGKMRDCEKSDLRWSNQQSRKPPTGLKAKDLVGIPWMVAFALRADGWYLRSDIIWDKTNAMPESARDRPTKAHEYLFLLSKSDSYYYDSEAIAEPSQAWKGQAATFKRKGGKATTLTVPRQSCVSHRENRCPDAWAEKTTRNKRSVWHVPTKSFSGAHFAVFPPDLIVPCIEAGSPLDGIVLDPFMGSGTTALVARKLGRKYIGFELNAEYVRIAEERLKQLVFDFDFGERKDATCENSCSQ